MNDILGHLSGKHRTLGGQRGWDMMREMLDNLADCRKKGLKVDLIIVSGGLNDYLQKCWLEMAPENMPMPTDIGGIPYQVLRSPGNTYAFLRDYIPWEKKQALKRGEILYGEDKKAVVATGEF